MQSKTRSIRRAVVGIASASLLASLGATAIAPATFAAETRITMPTPQVTYSVPDQGNATTTGVLVLAGDASYRVAVGGAVTANFGDVTYKSGTTPQGWRGNWYACSSVKQSLDTCSSVKSVTSGGNVSAKNATVPYVVTQSNLGKVLAFKGEVYGKEVLRNQDVVQVATSDRNKDLRVIPLGVPTSPRPVIGVNSVVAGQTARVLTGVWTMPAGLTFVSRNLTAWACPNANAGQGTSADFSISDCSSIKVTNSTAAITENRLATHSLTTTEAMGGKYLVASSTLVARTSNGLPYLYTVRSTATLLPEAAGVTPSPEPSPSASAEATDATDATDALGTSIGGTIVTPQQPTMKVVAKRSVTRGKKLLVTVKLAGKGGGTLGTGPAIVELVKSQDADAKSVKKLKSIEVEEMRGARYELINKKLKKGTYYLRVVFTDAGSGVQAASLRKVTIK